MWQFSDVPSDLVCERGAQIPGARLPWRLNLIACSSYLAVLCVELASCQPSSTYNFEAAPRFLEKCSHLFLAADLVWLHPYCSESVITGLRPYMLNLVSSVLLSCTHILCN